MMTKTILYIYIILKKFTNNEMPIFAGYASFFMFIAAFPLIMLIMSLIQFIPGVHKDDLLRALLELLPNMEQIRNLVTSIIDNLYVQSASLVASVAALTTLISASTGVYAIERGLRKIYQTGKGNYLMNRALAALYTFLLVIMIVLTLVLLVLGKLIQAFLTVHFPWVAVVTIHIIKLGGIISLVILFLMFLLIYTIVPGKIQKIRDQVPGAVFSTAAWIGLSYLFSFYFNNFRHMSYLYGSLTAIILTMFWLYAMICILFLGAVINSFLTQLKKYSAIDLSQQPGIE